MTRSNHLGDLAAALVDGRLPHADREQALAHVAGCAPCREELDDQRRLKARLSTLGTPEPSTDLLARLSAVPQSDTAAGTSDVVRGAGGQRGPRRRGPRAGRPTARPVPARRTAYGRMVLGTVSGIVAVLGVGLLLGGERTDGGVRPPVATFVEDHTATTEQLPLTDPAANFVLVNFGR